MLLLGPTSGIARSVATLGEAVHLLPLLTRRELYKILAFVLERYKNCTESLKKI